MTLPISAVLASQGLTAPAVSAGAGATVGAAPAAAAAAPAAAAATGVDPRMMALMQAFGGLRAPAPLPPPDTIRAPAPVAPQQANPAAIANTGATSAIASLLAAGLRPQEVPALGQLILPRG